MQVAKVIITPNFNELGYHCDIIGIYDYHPESEYNSSKAKEYSFKGSTSNPYNSYLLDRTSKKYLKSVSKTVLAALQNAYFIISSQYPPSKRYDHEPVPSEDEGRYIFGKFYREVSSNYIKNSVLVISTEKNFSLLINSKEILLYRNSIYNDSNPNSVSSVSVPPSRVDFSTYLNFIKSLNNICKMIKISEVDNEFVWNPTLRIRHICLKNNFYGIEAAYNEIISRGFHRR